MQEFVEIPCTKESFRNRKICYGIGINDAPYQTTPLINNIRVFCPYYSVWKNMLTRCYCKKSLVKRPTYLGCSVAKEWHIFSNFKAWIMSQDWKDKSLDKDILLLNNKVYSKDTCIFISQKINTLLIDCEASRGKYLVGITRNKRGKFIVRCSVESKSVYLGSFLCEDLASKAYCNYKKQHIISVANEQSDLRLKEALLRIASQY